jgi:hypothetical protein
MWKYCEETFKLFVNKNQNEKKKCRNLKVFNFSSKYIFKVEVFCKARYVEFYKVAHYLLLVKNKLVLLRNKDSLHLRAVFYLTHPSNKLAASYDFEK